MSSGRIILWAAIGIVTGVAHAVALWRSTHAYKAPGWSAAWRLPIVAATLVFAALAHGLLPAVVGWLVGLSVASIFRLGGTRRWM